MKQCPVCKAVVFDDMDRCYGCLYQFNSESETKGPQEASGLEGLENAAESRGVETLGRTAGSRGVETTGKTAESSTTAKPREIQGFRGTEVVHKTRLPALEIYRDAHDQTTLTVRLELHLDFAPAQTVSQDGRCATASN